MSWQIREGFSLTWCPPAQLKPLTALYQHHHDQTQRTRKAINTRIVVKDESHTTQTLIPMVTGYCDYSELLNLIVLDWQGVNTLSELLCFWGISGKQLRQRRRLDKMSVWSFLTFCCTAGLHDVMKGSCEAVVFLHIKLKSISFLIVSTDLMRRTSFDSCLNVHVFISLQKILLLRITWASLRTLMSRAVHVTSQEQRRPITNCCLWNVNIILESTFWHLREFFCPTQETVCVLMACYKGCAVLLTLRSAIASNGQRHPNWQKQPYLKKVFFTRC